MMFLTKLFCDFIFQRTESKIAKFLINSNKTVSVAESCTGGLLSSMFTDISGSSSFIKENFVTYANEAKTRYLNVTPETLEKHGAVSAQTAEEGVKGLIERTGCDYAVMTTGIAGPCGGTAEKPVGLVYIGIADKNRIKTIKFCTPKYVFSRRIRKFMFARKALLEFCGFLYET